MPDGGFAYEVNDEMATRQFDGCAFLSCSWWMIR
jgi:hypothetical protein